MTAALGMTEFLAAIEHPGTLTFVVRGRRAALAWAPDEQPWSWQPTLWRPEHWRVRRRLGEPLPVGLLASLTPTASLRFDFTEPPRPVRAGRWQVRLPDVSIDVTDPIRYRLPGGGIR